MEYMIRQDIESVMELERFTTSEIADELGVSRATISNWLNGKHSISEKHINAFYTYAFSRGIRLNKIKEQLYLEDVIGKDEHLLFHGAKTKLEGEIRLDCNKRINDFGNGFYCGESLEQSAMFVATHKNSSLYMLKFNPTGLKCKEYVVDREWMLTIAYHRGRLEEYRDTDIVREISNTLNDIDYIIAPIADNRMFEIIDQFIDGEITDVQCQHCLSATNLGMQYVFISDKAVSQLQVLEHCYLADVEKDAYLKSKQESFKISQDKVKLARRTYRNQGEYIEDIIK